ncbi:MAG: chorismate synthase [Lachnospiraceae bacterium]|nr:chorismate synthase [Lachnospiraceae bacterium]
MSGSVFGKNFTVMTFGESHGPAVGCVVDGCPAGLALTPELIRPMMERRAPGKRAFSTARNEADEIKILSGVFEGKTLGTPIAMLVENTDQRSKDYGNLAECFRPGHADYGYEMKYGFRDYRGGGRSSGRETIGRVAAGAVAKLILAERGISVDAYTCAVGDIEIDRDRIDLGYGLKDPLSMPDPEASQRAQKYLEEVAAEGDSAGGVVECIIRGLPAGVGEPVFDKLDACLSRAVMSIGAVKGIEFGEGFNAACLRGSENNDEFYAGDGGIKKHTNHSGGVLGGLSDGADVVFRAVVKPTPSISKVQRTVDKYGNNIELEIKGRHDTLIAPRAVVVVESMAAITIVDLMLGSTDRILPGIRSL